MKKILYKLIMILLIPIAFILPGCSNNVDVDIKVEDGYVMWTKNGDEDWQQLISVEDLKEKFGNTFQGEKGDAGVDGATWLTGDIDPVVSQGKNGDLYLNIESYNIYKKSNNAWEKIGNMRYDEVSNKEELAVSSCLTWTVNEVTAQVYGGVTGATNYATGSTAGNQYGATYSDNIAAGAASGTTLDAWQIGDIKHVNSSATATDVVITIAIENDHATGDLTVKLNALPTATDTNQQVTFKWVTGVVQGTNDTAAAYATAAATALGTATAVVNVADVTTTGLTVAHGTAGVIQVTFHVVDSAIAIKTLGAFNPTIYLTAVQA